ncbi:agmatine deiminase [Geotalea uraniireducens]|uniref:Agmatine deiminase n=1 Tax=Geotalea uraniireducens TaxID=351604 RepID=A0ABN6VV59_9BACT|nr:agmatine deiminase family protein [Geotalea uraniireducens]BDV42057.1 agmatine deiminase [Geotalea uraniireducens]
MTVRLPAEWEEQAGVLLAWPHEESDWHPWLPMVELVYAEIVKHITRFEVALIVTADSDRTAALLTAVGAQMERVRLSEVPTNDTWARDFGPITVERDGSPLLLDFGFNGWGLKFACDRDNLVTRRLHRGGAFGDAPLQTVGLILEGGSIESDGRGTLLTTAECLLNPNRNPHLTREEIGENLGTLFGVDRLLWLSNGYLAGDDTDSHIDTLARLAPNDTILYVQCDDAADEHYTPLFLMEKELTHFRTREGRPYRLIPLPWPRDCYDEEGNRLPATYANFLVINGAVLVPTYADPADDAALTAIGMAYPDREIIGIDCRPLILQHGSLHCITMQIPQGALS